MFFVLFSHKDNLINPERFCPFYSKNIYVVFVYILFLAQSAGAVEYTDCTSAEGQGLSNECPEYDIEQSDGEVPVMLGPWGMQSTLSLPLLPGPL